MKKSILSMALALLLFLGPASPAFGYSDIPDGHWSAGSVEQATQLGLFQGIGDGVFGRGQSISRAAFTAALVRLFGWEEVSPGTPSFTDVSANRWFYTAVETARANGALSAGSHTFRPMEDITRGEMAAMLVRGLGYASLAGSSGSSQPFHDVTTNQGFILIAYELGIIDGVGGGRFDPDGCATREQAAALLVRVHNLLYAKMTQLSDAGSYQTVAVKTPQAKAGAELPATPLEPLADLYDALKKLRDQGADMNQVVLRLASGGVRTVMDGERLVSEIIPAKTVQSLLQTREVNTYYSERYESAYFLYENEDGHTAVVWYQSEESQAAKLQLAKMFGVTKYVLQ